MIENLDKIQEDFNKVILYSQNYHEINTDALFDKWRENKNWFIKANEGKLIYEAPELVSFEISDEEKLRRVSFFIDDISYYNSALANFLMRNTKNFYDNKTLEEYVYQGKIIPKGMKISRAFKFFESDKERVDAWQTKMSMMLQENKISGRLCFSVHPLDFLSVSENTYNWRSCHALDGEYRAGNLSYMLDKSTVVCYLKGNEDTTLPRFPSEVSWNSKKWRMLLFVSTEQNCLFAGRQYPFFSEEALYTVRTHLKESLFPTKHWTSWTNKRIDRVNYGTDEHGCEWQDYLKDPLVAIAQRLYSLKQLVDKFEYHEDALHFNDLTRSSCYKAYYCWQEPYWRVDNITFDIGSEVPCLHCGMDSIKIPGSFLCNECELEYGSYEDEDLICHCECCGERIFVEDDSTYRTKDGYWVCESCLHDSCTYCECCQEYVWDRDVVFDEKRGIHICNECHEWLD